MGFPKRCLAPALPLCNTVAKIAALSGKTGALLEGPTCSVLLTVPLCSLQCIFQRDFGTVGAGAVAFFCGPFVGISRSVAPVLLVPLPPESRAELWGCFLALASFLVMCLFFRPAQGADCSLLLWHCLSAGA